MEGEFSADRGGVPLQIQRARGLSRLSGLIGRAEQAPGGALLIPRCRSVHSCFMRMAIDVVFVDADLTVVSSRRLDPWRFARERRACAVLELRAGERDRLELFAGRKIFEEGGKRTGSHPLTLHGSESSRRPDPDRGGR